MTQQVKNDEQTQAEARKAWWLRLILFCMAWMNAHRPEFVWPAQVGHVEDLMKMELHRAWFYGIRARAGDKFGLGFMRIAREKLVSDEPKPRIPEDDEIGLADEDFDDTDFSALGEH